MSKEYLEALEMLKTALHNEWLRFYPQFKELNEKTKFVDGVRMVSSDADAFLIVKHALQRLESIDNSNPSEALECLEKVSDYLNNVYDYKEIIEEVRKDIDTIKQALQRLAQIDKGIEICKKANEQKYVFIKETYGIVKEKFLDDLDYEVINNRLYVSSRGMYYDFPLKDYGNWWALTKEELE